MSDLDQKIAQCQQFVDEDTAGLRGVSWTPEQVQAEAIRLANKHYPFSPYLSPEEQEEQDRLSETYQWAFNTVVP